MSFENSLKHIYVGGCSSFERRNSTETFSKYVNGLCHPKLGRIKEGFGYIRLQDSIRQNSCFFGGCHITTCSRSNVVNKYCFAKPLFREQVVFSLVIELFTVNGGSIEMRNSNLAVSFTAE